MIQPLLPRWGLHPHGPGRYRCLPPTWGKWPPHGKATSPATAWYKNQGFDMFWRFDPTEIYRQIILYHEKNWNIKHDQTVWIKHISETFWDWEVFNLYYPYSFYLTIWTFEYLWEAMLDTTCRLVDPQLYCRQLSELQVQISWDGSGFVPPGDAPSPVDTLQCSLWRMFTNLTSRVFRVELEQHLQFYSDTDVDVCCNAWLL